MLPSRSVITMSADVILSYGTPLGLITHRPLARETALALPKVETTSPLRTSSRLASRTSVRSASSTGSSSGIGGDAAQFGKHVADRGRVGITAAEREIKLAVEGEELLADR